MQLIALIRNGIVSSVAVWDGISEWSPGSQYTQVNVTNLSCVDGSPIGPQCTYDGTNFYPPSQ
jgi:hypothetical protein